MDLQTKIINRSANLSIIGLGYVGLPLMVAFAEAGFKVVGIDTDLQKVDSINRYESYIQDVPSDALLQNRDRLSATSTYDHLIDTDVVVICVPTPLNKSGEPDMSFILVAVDEIASRLHPEMLVVLESTTYPGTTEEVVLPKLTLSCKGTLEIGKQFHLAFSPERIDPGRTDWTLYSTPKVVGGITPECLQLAELFYHCVVEKVVPVSSPRTAETTKLFENAFRAVNIALVNELMVMCNLLGVDVWEVIEAARTKPFGFMTFYPGPGTGGHCIPVDPQYLAWKMQMLGYDARLVRLSMEINNSMPRYVFDRISKLLDGRGQVAHTSNIVMLGVSYKANIGDLRESPALELLRLFIQEGIDVAYHDPYVRELVIEGNHLHSISLTQENLQAADCVVIVTPHSAIDWDLVIENSKLIIDTRNATKDIDGQAKVIKL
jgi:UDP-N-acetyl-D-glucosamine dehydrogenase